MADIKRLLNKKGWTGRELGILELTNMCSLFQQALDGKEPVPIVTPEQLSTMVSTLTDRQQARTYNGYIAIHEWLRVRYNIALTHEQQAQLQFRTLESYLSQAMLAENVYSYIAKLPAIMTRKQYDEIRAERKREYLASDSEEDLLGLFLWAVSHFVSQLRDDPKKPNPLKAIRKKYVSQPVRSELILSRYNQELERGYFILEDGSGRRSDQMTEEEWDDVIITPAMREYLKEQEIDPHSTSRLARDKMSGIIEAMRSLYVGGTEEEAGEILRKRDTELGFLAPVSWHYYEDPPQDLTKWDLIEQELLDAFYPADLDGSGEPWSESNEAASVEDLCAEFGELVTAVLSDIDKRFFGGKAGLADTPPAEWASRRWSQKELYDLDFYEARAVAEADTTLFDGDPRAVLNGIAILQENGISTAGIDERGYYQEPAAQGGDFIGIKAFTLEAFFTDADEYANNSTIVENARTVLLQSYYHILGYNKALELVGEYYGVPDLTVFKLDLPGLATKIDAMNSLVPILYSHILFTDYADESLKLKKLQVLRDFFQPVECDKLEIPAESIQAAKDLLPDFKAFASDGGSYFSQLLCDYQPSGEGD